MSHALKYGELVLLMETQKKRRTYTVALKENSQLHTHQGSLNHDDLVGLSEGSRVSTNTGTVFLVFRPRVADRMMKVRRKTQIIYPKDAGWLLMALDLFPGAHVIEMGIGSGAFTILLAQTVGEKGKIYSFDRREEFIENALFNLSRSGYAERVTTGVLEAGESFPVENADGVFLDLPNPWVAIPPAYQALAPGRPLSLLVPNAEQLKTAVDSLHQNCFGSIEALELMERRMLVRQKEGVRPQERMIGFTGYLVSARKLENNRQKTAEEGSENSYSAGAPEITSEGVKPPWTETS